MIILHIFIQMNPDLPHNTDKITKLQEECDVVKDIMIDNVDQIIASQEQLSDIRIKTDDLERNSKTFQKRSTQLKRTMCWQDYKARFIIGGIVMFVLLVLILIIATTNSSN